MPRQTKPASRLARKSLSPAPYARLLESLQRLLEKGRRRAEESAGQELVRTYHALGARLLAHQLAGHANCGSAILRRLADDLPMYLGPKEHSPQYDPR